MATLIHRQQGEKPRFLTPTAIQDGADVILVYVWLTGYADSTRIQVRRVKPDGKHSLIRDIQTAQGGKEDNSTAVRMGKDLHVFWSTHVGDPIATMEREIVKDVFTS